MTASAKTKKIATPTAPTDAVAEFLSEHPTGSRFEGFFVVDRAPMIPSAVILLPPKAGSEIRAPWNKAMVHCEQLEIDGVSGLVAPDRFQALLCYKRLSQRLTTVPEFKEGGAEAFERDYYWTSEAYEFGSDCAWGQDFGHGDSLHWGKDYALRVRPVRILFI